MHKLTVGWLTETRIFVFFFCVFDTDDIARNLGGLLHLVIGLVRVNTYDRRKG
jgi:hypothetical protein